MLRNILTSAVFAGVFAGVVASALQFWWVTPLLLEGELYETGARIHFATDGVTQSVAGSPSIWAEPARHLMSVGFGMVVFTGFAFLMVAGFASAERAGFEVTPKQGLMWGLAGFIAVQLAPAIGMPPELPGTVAPEVGMRQMWWIVCVLCTAVGLALLAFSANMLVFGCGIAVLLAPHVIGAPHLDTYFGIAPPELSAYFATRSLGAAALSWSLLGLVAATLWTRSQEA